jgi:hypothetical protein
VPDGWISIDAIEHEVLSESLAPRPKKSE